ncbi:MAG TPA: hypothetical protein VFL41_00040 [Gaiellaceae bacterium]|nr:hypothetical protein [Gaiellaceae bacterium]
MSTSKRHIHRWLVAACLAAAVAAPAATAGSPDDRPFYRGPAEQAPAAVSPDDRPFYRGPAQSVSPDDRPFYRGPAVSAPATVSPDDRPFYRASTAPLTSAIVPIPVREVSSSSGFDWGDAAIGGTFGLALALCGLGAILIAQRRRSSAPARLA